MAALRIWNLVKPAQASQLYHLKPANSIVKPTVLSGSRCKSTSATADKDGDLDFTDYKKAFQAKTTTEIVRALAVYRICSVNLIVEWNKELVTLSRKVLGKRAFEFVMKNSFYGHFVAGESQQIIKPKLALMQDYGVGAILDYAVEADMAESSSSSTPSESEKKEKSSPKKSPAGYDISYIENRFLEQEEFADRRANVQSARTYFYEGEESCDANMKVFLQCIDTTGETAKNGFAAIKVTALGRPKLLLKISQILSQIRHHFEVASRGVALKKGNISEEDFWPLLEELGVGITKDEASAIFKIVDTDGSGEVDFVEWNNFLTPQLQLSKVFQTAARTGSNDDSKPKEWITSLTDKQIAEMENMQQRMYTICKRAKEKGVRLMVDAEQTYFQPAITKITLDAMRVFNKEEPVVFNTYQCYQKDAKNLIDIDIELSRREGFHFAAKLVRGAYVEQERMRAESVGYPDPIHETIEDTSACYNNALTSVLKEVANNNANVMVASHNEDSVRHTLQTMKELGIHRGENKVFFGQLLGMCDAVSYALGAAGYAAYKYVPYGPVEEVMPYLSRRACENRSLMKGVVKERNMLWWELKRRYKDGDLKHSPGLEVVG